MENAIPENFPQSNFEKATVLNVRFWLGKNTNFMINKKFMQFL